MANRDDSKAQGDQSPAREDADAHRVIRETRWEFEEERPDGARIRISYSEKLTIGPTPRKWNAGTISTLGKYLLPLAIFFTIVIIGLIAVGPEGVWREIKEILPDLFK